MFFAHFVTDLYTPIIIAVLPFLVSVEGYSYLAAGVLVTIYNVTSSLTQPVFGYLNDKNIINIPVSVSLVLSAVCITSIGWVHSYSVLVIFIVISALGHSTFHPKALSLVCKISSGSNRGRITSIFVVGGNLGYAIGPVITGYFLTTGGLKGISFMMIPGLIVAYLFYRARSFNKKLLSEEAEKVAKIHFEKPDYEKKGIFLLLIASTFRSWAVFCIITFVPLLLVERGNSIFFASLVTTALLIAGVCGQLTGGIISDHIGKKEFVLWSMMLALPSFAVFFFSEGLTSIVGLILFGFTLWSSFAVTVTMAHEIMPDDVGFASGLIMGVALGAGGFGVMLNGYLADKFSIESSLALIPFLVIVAVVAIGMMKYPKYSKKKVIQ